MRPLVNIIAKRLGFERSLADAAVGREILQHQEYQEVPPPLFLDGQLSAVTGAPARDSLAEQLDSVRATHVFHAAVERYILSDCVVHPKGVEWAGGSQRKEPLALPDLLGAPLLEVDNAHYPMSPASHRYFGHFLRDACSNALLAQPDQTLLLDLREDWPDARSYVQAFRLNPAARGPRFVRRLTICADHSQGSLKQRRYAEMRNRIDAAFGARGQLSDDVYLRRGSRGATRRQIRNEYALIEVLDRHGFRIVNAEASVEELADGLRNCRRIVSLEGSHVNHAYFLAPSGIDLCLLMPSDRFTMIHRGITDAAGGRFGFLVCRKSGDQYDVDTDQLLRTLDLF